MGVWLVLMVAGCGDWSAEERTDLGQGSCEYRDQQSQLVLLHTFSILLGKSWWSHWQQRLPLRPEAALLAWIGHGVAAFVSTLVLRTAYSRINKKENAMSEEEIRGDLYGCKFVGLGG